MKTNRQNSMKFMLALIGALIILPDMAQAQVANGVGNMMSNIAFTTNFSMIFSTFSYLLGIALAFWGVMRLKLWSDGGGQVSIMEGVWRIAGAALMIALPSFWGAIMDSIFSTWGNSASGSYNLIGGLTANYNGEYLGLDQMMENFIIDVYAPAKILLNWAGYCVGFACMINGVYRLAQAGQAAAGRAPSTRGTVGYLLGGALMITTGDLMDGITDSIFGTNSPGTFSTLAYSLPGVNAVQVNAVIQSLFAFVEIIGWIAFVRGIYLLVKLSQGAADRSHAHAFTHIVFGGLAVNMYAVVKALQSTLGISIVT